MQDERHQFRILYRDFLSRLVDLELIAAVGDVRGLIVRFGSMLAALSFVLAYMILPRYATSIWSHDRLVVSARGDEEFLISTTIVVAGLCSVMTWNAVFPDRLDGLILGLIPVRARTMILARIAAIATVLGTAILVLNSFTGLSFPFVLAAGLRDALFAFGTWWLVVAAAGIFTFCRGLAVQGVAAQLFSWRAFLRISGFLQLAALFTVLALFFLAPPFNTGHPPAFIPSFWFVGLLHELRGDRSQLFGSLAARAMIGLSTIVPLSIILYILSWSRNVRRMVESPDILPAKHARIASSFAKMLSPAPLERAILLFTARTIARSRQHRMILAIYGGYGFALSLAFSRSFLEGTATASWNKPNVSLLIAGLLLLSCAVAGVRAIFSLPFAMPSNWIFRITAVHRPAPYFAAVRKSLFALAALPVWIAAAVWYLAIWPGRPALEHMLVLVLAGIVMMERSLYQFRKIPFTCSWLPGSTHWKMKAGAWGLAFLALANGIAGIELWSMEKSARMVVLTGVLGAAAIHARRRTRQFATEPDNRLQFEDLPPADIFALDLRQDGTSSDDQAYVEAIDPHRGRSFAARLRPLAVAALLLLATGVVYEQAGEWRDRRNFPQIGHSVDIGGRSLNIFCSGAGSPVVVFETGFNQPGYTWLLVQPEVAKWTRACWYDRAGFGWSDPAPGPRTGTDIADDLHKLLRAAGIPPPYVLVAHSFGGFDARVFAARYRSEVAGLVLAESADEFEDPDQIPKSMQSRLGQLVPPWIRRPAAAVAKFLVHAGLARLMDDGAGPPPPHVAEHDAEVIHAVQLQPRSFDMYIREGLDRDQTITQVRAIRDLGTLLLAVLTGARSVAPQNDQEEALEVAAYMRVRIYERQANLARLSTRGRQVVLENSGHAIPYEAPGAVVDSAREVVEEARSAADGAPIPTK